MNASSKTTEEEIFHHRLGQDVRKYDSKDGIGRVESGTETESNAGAVAEAQSFTLLTASTALLTIESFSLCPLCLCGESILKFLTVQEGSSSPSDDFYESLLSTISPKLY